MYRVHALRRYGDERRVSCSWSAGFCWPRVLGLAECVLVERGHRARQHLDGIVPELRIMHMLLGVSRVPWEDGSELGELHCVHRQSRRATSPGKLSAQSEAGVDDGCVVGSLEGRDGAVKGCERSQHWPVCRSRQGLWQGRQVQAEASC